MLLQFYKIYKFIYKIYKFYKFTKFGTNSIFYFPAELI